MPMKQGARGDWYPMTGEHHGRYSGLLIGASGVLAPRETAAICPFDMGPAVAPDEVDLDNVTVEQFSVQRKYARPLARRGIEAGEANTCQQNYVPGRARNVQVNARIEGLASEPILLPVWIMAYRYRDRLFRFLVNGQTGTASGEAPFSYLKLTIIIAAAVLAILTIFCVLGAWGVARGSG